MNKMKEPISFYNSLLTFYIQKSRQGCRLYIEVTFNLLHIFLYFPLKQSIVLRGLRNAVIRFNF